MNTPKPMTIMEAVLHLRSGNPERLTNDEAARLYEVLEQNPGIHALTGDAETVQRFRAVLEKRLAPVTVNAASEATAKTRRPFHRLAATAAILLLTGIGVRQVLRNDPASDKRGAPFAAQPAPASAVTSAPEQTMEKTSPSPPTPAPAAPAEAAPANDAPRLEVLGGDARLEPDGEGGYRLTALDGATHVKLTGTVKHLRLDGINGQAELDASELTAERIEFRGQVNGTSTLKLHAPGGAIEFHDAVGGATKVEIAAPGGTVIFRKGDARVAGSTQMNIIARSVDFAAGMDGGSKADVTLTNNGSLHYASLGGGSRLHYRKSAPDDAGPTVMEGEVWEGGRLVLE